MVKERSNRATASPRDEARRARRTDTPSGSPRSVVDRALPHDNSSAGSASRRAGTSDRPKLAMRPARVALAEEISERDDVIYGRNPVVEALRAGRPLNRLLMASGMKDAASLHVKTQAREAGVLVEEVPRDRLDQVTHGSHQGFVAFTAPKGYASMEEIVSSAKSKGEAPLIIVLDEVEDPRNLGAILRTADAAGVHGIVIPQRRAVGLTETVAKSSAGAIEYVPVAREVNLVRAVEQLKSMGLWVAGVDMTGPKDHYEADLTGPLAIVIGGEGKGVGRLLREKCDFIIRIPMKGRVSSLNASVATSVVLYEAVRQRAMVRER